MKDSGRLNLIWERTVSALRQVVADLKVTEDELHVAGEYFNRLGQSGMFPALLDVSLAMTSIDVHRAGVRGTRPNLEGPFYRPGAPFRPTGGLLDHEASEDARMLTLRGCVRDCETGAPIAHAELDFWQADEYGKYDDVGFHLRGKVLSGVDGNYSIRTLVPNDYTQHDNDPIGELYRQLGRVPYRAAHIHLKVRLSGTETLTTQLFMNDSPHLGNDYVVGAVSDDLVIKPVALEAGRRGHREYQAIFDIDVLRLGKTTDSR